MMVTCEVCGWSGCENELTESVALSPLLMMIDIKFDRCPDCGSDKIKKS